MKAFAVVLLFLFAAVQGRSAGVQVETAAALGENPWVVHLRVAVSTSGYLNTCIGTLLDDSWVLTSANCVANVRFIWIRYGAVDVVRPELVTETSTVLFHPNYNAETGENDVALIRINRVVVPTDNVAPVSLPSADGAVPSTGKVCKYGTAEDNINPGELLKCSNVEVETSGDGLVVSAEEGAITNFDIGAALVSEGVQYGVLTNAPSGDDNKSSFINIFKYLDWINSEIGVVPNDGSRVNFVN